MDASSTEVVRLFTRVSTDKLQSIYERHGVDPADGPEKLMLEIELDGANTLASVFRGWSGVPYSEVVHDVAESLGISFGKSQSAVAIERDILTKVAERFYQGAEPEDRAVIDRILREEASSRGVPWAKGGLTAGTMGLLINQVGTRVVAAIVRRIVVAQSGRIAGIFAARSAAATATSIATVAIPVINVGMLAWTVWDIAGAAMRKTTPTVIEIALLRMEYGGQG